ncbi:thiolase family protein [Rhodococcus olei]|uniref:Thiolase family protein n=1 Tax=Rhodococcus olei TaxID=2161675 RepID=A0ABP8PUW9_9NOCA
MAHHPYENVVIAGAYNTRQARTLPGETSSSISLEAALGVLDETGIRVDEVDGVFGAMCGEVVYGLGLNSSMTSGLDNVGIPAVVEAVHAIASGMCTTALVVAGVAGAYSDRGSTAPWTRPANEWVVPFGLYTAAEFALVARRHMHVHGTTPEQLATVAATIRNNGSINPQAVYHGRGPYSPRDILDSRMVADPFHLLDCAMTSEGGCALVLTTPARAKDLELRPIRVLGAGADRLGPAYQHPPSFDLTGSRSAGAPNGLVGQRAARIAFTTAGLAPKDVDVCEFYDPFSFEIIRQFEAFGFCSEGEGGDFVMDGRIEPDGEYPITTDGGLMSFSHAGRPQLLQRVARGVHQLQGRCTTNQIAGAEVALCSNGGSGALYSDVILLGTEL